MRFKDYVENPNAVLKVALALVFSGCSRQDQTISPVKRTISESVYASGVVKGDHQYQVYASVNGIVEELFVYAGDTVSAEAPLMRIGNNVPSLNRKNAELAARFADLGVNRDRLMQADLDIEVARQVMINDSILFVRQQTLWNQGIGTRNEFDKRQLAYKMSKSSYQSGVLKMNELKRQLKYADEQSKTNYEITNVLFGDHIVRTQRNGRVYKVLMKEGEYVTTATPVAVVGDANDFYVELDVDELDISRLTEKQRVLLSFESYRGVVYEGVVSRIEPLMNEATRSFTVKVSLTDPPAKLYPNISVEANIIIQTVKDALTIPVSFITSDSLVQIKPGKKRKVKIGVMDYQFAEIVEGLHEADILELPER